MEMDYRAMNSGLLNGLATGQQMMRQHQQDQRQAGMDQRALVKDEQTQADRLEDRAYLLKQRGMADEDRTLKLKDRETAEAEKTEKKRVEEANRLAGVFNQLDADGKLTEREMQTMLRLSPGFLKFIDNDGTGKEFDQLVKDPTTGMFAVNLKMPDGSFAPLGENRQKGEDATLWPMDKLKQLTKAAIVSSGADSKLFEAKKAEKVDTFGDKESGYYTVGKDGKPVELVKGMGRQGDYVQVETADGLYMVNKNNPDDKKRVGASKPAGGSGDGLPAEAKLIDYYITQHGMSKEAAREEAKRAKDSPRKWEGDHYKSLLKMEAERVLYEGETRQTPEDIRKQAREDANYFFGESETSNVATPTAPGGMATFPTFATRPAYQGPVRTGMARNPNIEEAQVISETPKKTATVKGGVKAEMSGDKVTFGGKQYRAVNGIVTIDGKKYRVQ